jgi:predicted ATPase
MVGREDELRELKTYLDSAVKGQGSTIFLSGEAGIGKTRLVEELKQIAQSQGFQILSGNCMYESLTPFMPIMEALRSGGLESLFAEEAPRVEAVYLVTNAGILIRDVVRDETQLDPDVFASMFTTVTDFLNESFSTLSGKEEKGGLNSLGYQNYRILIENHWDQNLIVVLTGKENEFLLNDMRETLLKITKTFKKTLEEWGGDEKKVAGIEELLKPLITSGKYDGIYYGKKDPKARRNLLFENVSMGLARHSHSKPTLLCIEDLQWVDPSSLALLHYFSRNTTESGLLILGTYRPEDVTTMDGKGHPLINTMQLMDREGLLEKIELSRLPEESITELLFALLGENELTGDFKISFYKETEGNPLFVIELVKLLLDEDIIRKYDGTWKQAKSIKEGNIPSKVYNVISRRLNRVEMKDRNVLDYASVIGEVFDPTLLASSLDIKRVQLLERLRYLEQIHRLIHPQNGNFKFDHSKIKEVLYNEIPEELGKEYHQIIAETFETLKKDNLDEVIGDLAFHYYHGRDREKALIFLMKAAEKAKKEYSNEEAIRFYNFALEFEENQQRRMELFEVLGDLYRMNGEYDKSIDSYEISLALAKGKKKTRITIKIGDVFQKKGEYEKSMRHYKQVIDLVKGEDCMEKSLALYNMSITHPYEGAKEKAIDSYKKLLEQPLTINNKYDIATCYQNIGGLLIGRGKFDIAFDYLEKSYQIRKEVGDQRGIARSLYNTGFLFMSKGEYITALDYLERALVIDEKIGDQEDASICLHNIGDVYQEFGEYEKALDFYEKSLKICHKIGYRVLDARNYHGIGVTYLKKGDLKNAMEFCNRAFMLSQDIGLDNINAATRELFGRIYAEQEDWEKSIRYFEDAININKEIGHYGGVSETYYYFGLMWKKKGENEKAKSCLKKFRLDLNVKGLAEEVNAVLESL